MGITRYDFRGVWEGVPGIMTVYLRPVCIGQTLFVRGMMGVITVELEADSGARYTAPAALLDHAWALRLVDRSTNSSTRVRVYKTVDRGERTLSYSQLEARLPAPKQLELFVDGSPWRHELYLPECALSSDSPDHPLQQLPGSLLNDKHWLVVMLPRVLPAPTQQYADALLSHLRYHQQLGYAGMLLLSDLHQAHELMQQQELSTAVQEDAILLWPWEHEHPKHSHPLYWQVPRYQLVAVAGWGRASRAAFLDPDDFLVLPGGQPVGAEGSCLGLPGSQTDLLQQLHWEASSLPAEDLTGSSSGSSSGSSGDEAGGPQQPAGGGGAAAAAPAPASVVLRVPRFDALLTPSHCATPADCVRQHARWHAQPGAALLVSSCPVQEGGLRASRRPIISPHDVVAVRVFTAAPRGGRLDGPTSPPSCAYILHVTNLWRSAQPHGATTAAMWQPAQGAAASGGDGGSASSSNGSGVGTLTFASGQQLPQRQSLVDCQAAVQPQQPQQQVPGAAHRQEPGNSVAAGGHEGGGASVAVYV